MDLANRLIIALVLCGCTRAPASATDGDAQPAAGDASDAARAPLQCPATANPSGPSTSKVPAEFLARSYVEAFGRMPDQGGWEAYSQGFAGAGCSVGTVGGLTKTLFKSNEFLLLPYSNSQRLLALIRGALGREPTQDLIEALLPRLEADPDAWCDVVDQVVAMPEYTWLTGLICDPNTPNYHREATFPPFPITSTVDQTTVQAQLDAAVPGDVVALPESALVLVTSSLIVPAGVTLTTTGASGLAGRTAYARLAHIARASAFPSQVVRLRPGATLEDVWVDGRRMAFLDANLADGQNVFIDPSSVHPSTVRWIRSDNPSGPQNIRFDGTSAPNGCAAGNIATENLVNNFSNDNRLPNARWADGIFTICESSTISNNELIDPSDVGLIAFFPMNASPQHSQITGNRVLSAGNDAFGGLGTDPWTGANGSCSGDCNFTGTLFDHNILWSGPNTHYVIGIAAGTRAWSFISPHGNGRGAHYTNNTSGASRARVQLAIYVSGMLDGYFDGNWNGALLDYVSTPSVPANHCGTGATLANMPAFASGSLQSAAAANRDNCL